MNTLDRYIARQYLFNVLALLVLLFTFVVAIDVTLNIDRFVRNAGRVDPSSTGLRRAVVTAMLVFDLWGPRLLQLFAFTVGLALVGGMGFTLTQMVRHRELSAMLASGISLRRVARPILVVAVGFMILKVVDHELVLSHPRIAPLLIRDHGEVGNRSISQFGVPPTPEGGFSPRRAGPETADGGLEAGAGRRVFMADRFDPDTHSLTGVIIWERDAAGVATRTIRAASATWRAGSDFGAGRGYWVLTDATARSMRMPPPGSGVTEVDPGPVPTEVETDLGPEQLIAKRHERYSQTLSWAQIGALLENPGMDPQMREKLQRIRYGRVSTVLSGLLSLIITIPFFLLREPKNMLVQSLKCAPVAIVALMGGVLLATVPVPGLPPGFSAFLPVIALLPIAVASVSWVRT
ncbi:MAG: LptF/LptG family permease [Phycisphaeraceae bacterium]|nr:LptF/LptG family permease [Phycisphaeraceae bacterium]